MGADSPKDTNEANTSSALCADAILDKTMKILEELVIDWGMEPKKCVESNSRDKISNNGNEVHTTVRRQSTWRRRVRWTPYSIPRRLLTPLPVDDLQSVLTRVQFPEMVDVEGLRLCLLDRRDIPVACSIQAARPPTPDGEVDELSEYFAHFVRVDLKMSSLAESMYV
ncbi:hypothetical protein KIN20_006369 [Parelaphostrongylus tenuis]|uniref:Oxidative stress-responsive serine-rich protein 1 n=1 Tax=Parelaphostrongylus tenuis TaxID=148309 RepID=A0AAD5MK95_PARTN|nr:hypothetical protein KIN20_006369 [Parelaphostrongylus tenuis]